MLIGHSRVYNFLKNSVKTGRLSHAYLFTGLAHLGKRKMAELFIEMISGKTITGKNHPDIIIVEPKIDKEKESKEFKIGIDEIKELQRSLSLFPFELPYKIVLINEAEKITLDAAHCLLKTLEEPPAQSILILISSHQEQLLKTIVSRCQLVKFLSVKDVEIEKSLNINKSILRLSRGRPGLAINYLNNPELISEEKKIPEKLTKILKSNLGERWQYAEELSKDVELALRVLKIWLIWFRDLMLIKNNCQFLAVYETSSQFSSYYTPPKINSIIRAVKKAETLLKNPSFNHRLILEVLMVELS